MPPSRGGQPMNRTPLVTGGLVVLALTCISATDQWPQFRGQHAGVVADDPALPDAWSETDNVVWKIPIPGLGWSSPIVWDDHIIVTTAVGSAADVTPTKGLYDPGDDHGRTKSSAVQRWVVYDVDFNTGRIRWERELRNALSPTSRHVKNSFASETAATDGERVYVYFGAIGLVTALDMSGKPVWTREIGAFDGRYQFGAGTSPVVHKDRLYVVNDNNHQSFIVAFDRKSGSELWRVNR